MQNFSNVIQWICLPVSEIYALESQIVAHVDYSIMVLHFMKNLLVLNAPFFRLPWKIQVVEMIQRLSLVTCSMVGRDFACLMLFWLKIFQQEIQPYAALLLRFSCGKFYSVNNQKSKVWPRIFWQLSQVNVLD